MQIELLCKEDGWRGAADGLGLLLVLGRSTASLLTYADDDGACSRPRDGARPPRAPPPEHGSRAEVEQRLRRMRNRSLLLARCL